MATKELWDKGQSGNMKARNELVMEYMPLVQQIAGLVNRKLPDLVEMDDLVSDGTIGLIDAIDKFDWDKGFKFETYATTRIRGAILDGLRRLDWVPRSERSSIREYYVANEHVSAAQQRKATDEEINEYLGWDSEEFLRVAARAAELNGGVSTLENPEGAISESGESVPNYDTPISYMDIPGSTERLENVQFALLDAIDELDDFEKTILGLRYHANLKFSEIGALLEVSESRVSQIHTQLMERLREFLVGGA